MKCDDCIYKYYLGITGRYICKLITGYRGLFDLFYLDEVENIDSIESCEDYKQIKK